MNLEDQIVKALGNVLAEAGGRILAALTAAIPEIATLGVILCAAGWMITGDGSTWLGRMALVLGGAVVWLMLT